MIIDVKKFLVLGAKEEIDLFFDRAQHQGIVEFIPSQAKKGVEISAELHQLGNALKILRKLPLKKAYEGEQNLALADEIAQRIVELKTESDRLHEEQRLLETEIVRVAPFGDFSLDDIDFIEREGNRRIQFFCNKSEKTSLLDKQEGLVFISTDYDLDYFIAISKEGLVCPGRIEMRIDRPLGELRSHHSFVKESLHQIGAELKGFAGHIDFLHEAFLERLNDYHLLSAKKMVSFPLHNSLFAVEAWVPSHKVRDLYAFIDGMAITCEPILVEESDKVPTYMENQGNSRLGEDLVQIYDIPAPQDKDPSGWIFWFFVIFFSVIVNDGGYGLIYLGICLYCKYKFPQMKKSLRRFLKLATALSIGCVVWGILSTSFFGIQMKPGGFFEKISPFHYLVVKKADYHLEHKDEVYRLWIAKLPQLSTVTSGAEMLQKGVSEKGGHIEFEVQKAFTNSVFLEFSLLLGFIHIALSLLRYAKRHWAGIGWVVFMAGCYLYFPSVLKATSILNFSGLIDKQEATVIGMQILYTGVALALILALIQKKLKGIGEISTAIQVFADVLSYLRLYALGLSTAIMAETFNALGQEVGLFFGFLVILVGHALTISMGLMTGTIHGLRLNFIEWYHHCFNGGGRLFSPLKRFIKDF